MKKLLALILSISMIAMVGCTSGDDKADVNTNTGTEVQEEITIEWWTPNWDEVESREIAAEFEEANPGITVDIVVTDWDTYKSKITAAISANNAPEVCTVLLTDIKQFASKGLLVNVASLDNTISFDDILPASLAITSYEDGTYGIPFRYDGSGVYYNADMLSEVGYDSFPETFEELEALNKKLVEVGYTSTAWPFGNQPNTVTRFVQSMYSFGGNILNEDGTKVTLNEQPAIDALQYLVDSMNNYALQSSLEFDNTKLRDAFANEQFAWYIGGPFDIPTFEADYLDLNFKTAVIPGVDGMGTTTANGWCVMIPEKSENHEAAAKLVSYISTSENQTRLTDSFPASYEALEYEQFASEELKPFAAQLENSKEEPSYERYAEMEPIIFNYVQSALTGVMSVEEACEKMTEDLTNLLGF